MESQVILPLLVVFCLGGVLGRVGFLNDTFISTAIEINYRVALPVVVFWGISGNQNSVLFFRSYWGVFLLTPMFILTAVTLFKFFWTDLQIPHKGYLNVLIKILIPFILSLIGYTLDSKHMGRVCLLSLAVIPSIDMAVKFDLDGRAPMFSNLLDQVRLFVKEIILHPLLIVCFMGIGLLGANVWLLSLWENMINFIYPAVLPFCLVVTGAIFGTSKPVKKLIALFH